MALQTSGIMMQIVFRATLKSYYRVRYLSPEARSLIVMASFKPGSRHLLRLVSFFWILGPTLFNISSNMAPKMRWCPPYSALSLICDSGPVQVFFWQTPMAAPKISWASCSSFGPQIPLPSEVVAVWPTAVCL